MDRESWITPYISRYRFRFLVIMLIALLATSAGAALMFTSGFLISKAALRPYNILMLYIPIVGVRAFGISRAVLHYVERLVSHDAILRVLSDMRVKLYRVLEPQALRLRSLHRTGDLLGMLSEDIEHLQNLYIRTLFPSIIALVLYAGVVLALGYFDPAFALLLALYIGLLVLVFPYLSLKLMRAANREAKQRRSLLYRKLTDAVLGMNDWLISGRHGRFIGSYEGDELEAARVERKLHIRTLVRNLAAQLVIGAIMVSMVYWAGLRSADGTIDHTWIAAFVLSMMALSDVFLPVSDAVSKLPSYENSLERLRSVERQEAAAPDQAVPQEQQRFTSAHLSLSGVSYRYGNQDSWQLQDITLNIPQGRRIAIIGRSGAGKSTLLKLLQGAVQPDSGSITWNGRPLHQIGDPIGRAVSVLNQRPHLFDATVASNIRLGRPDATEEEVREAARKVRLDGLIESLPEGYRTPMLEAGQRFSGGEGQRIALARILLQNTPVVLLDEPTVGLDPTTENALLSTIFDTLQGKTLIWITHHLAGVRHMDEVIFMDKGRIIMQGRHEELMEQEERYRRLYRLDNPLSFETLR